MSQMPRARSRAMMAQMRTRAGHAIRVSARCIPDRADRAYARSCCPIEEVRPWTPRERTSRVDHTVQRPRDIQLITWTVAGPCQNRNCWKP